jgi:hypothetical protein
MIMELDFLVGKAQYFRCIQMKVNLVTIQNAPAHHTGMMTCKDSICGYGSGDLVFKVDTLPIFGVGHSFGALAQLLIGGHYTSLPDLSGFGCDFLII